MTGSQGGVIVPGMPQRRADMAYAVVPMRIAQAGRRGACRVEVSEASGGNSGRYLAVPNKLSASALSSLTRWREYEGLDAQPVQHRQHCGGLQRGAVIAQVRVESAPQHGGRHERDVSATHLPWCGCDVRGGWTHCVQRRASPRWRLWPLARSTRAKLDSRA